MNKKIMFAVLVLGVLLLLNFNVVAEKSMVERDLSNMKDIVKDKYIERFGVDCYNELYNNVVVAVSSSVYEFVKYEYTDGVISSFQILSKNRGIAMDLAELLIAITLMIAEIVALFFGHGEMGFTIAFFVCAVFMFVPCRLLSLVAIFEDYSTGEVSEIFLRILDSISGINIFEDLQEILWEYGLIGGVFVLLLASPVLIMLIPLILLGMVLLPFLVLPVIRMVYTFDILAYVLGSVFGIAKV